MPVSRVRGVPTVVVAVLAFLVLVAACSTTSGPGPSAADVPATGRPSTSVPSETSSAPNPRAPTSRSHAVTPASPRASAPEQATERPAAGPLPAISGPAGAPVIAIDPGHSRSIHAIDPANGLDVSDYENEPEMHDVFHVARIVRAKLLKAGYRVVLTKRRVNQRRSLLQRAQVADRAHAALALSIHDQAGRSSGIGFRAGNNIVYYQRVGDYRASASGHRVHFRDHRIARLSKKYGKVFRRERHRTEREHVALQGSTGYNLGSRGLAPGNIWLVQLLSHVPWIYNESGGNSSGRSGLDRHDKHVYADALVASVEHCIPPPR